MTKPRVILIAGPNGSGKSTLTNMFMEKGMDFGEYINPDEIAKELGELGKDYDTAVREAQRLAESRRTELLNSGISHSFESVMSHPSKIEYLVTAKAKGFDVILLFVGINDPLVNVQRVADRVTKGGHDVPTEKIVERYRRTMDMLHQAATTADRALIFDNTDSSLGLTQAAEVERGRLIDWNPCFPWIRKYLVSKFEGN
ncbi:zeta toxin family protein [Microbulbifer halophilus]|uniref:Zeta toxin family protein n=1 Tax=Microbulbifer halophilus TaxID=453963 RepID=A0ABW5ECR7_9GAMM|nr:zeta toxin family protein [Microbulbifer halophilus]MCW8126993.1 zeta toxin family protein [Microbulbifer halophilus]